MSAPVILAVYWFAALGAFGTFFPLFSLYLSENLGLSGVQTGIVMASIPLAGMIAQPLWGALADRSGSRVRVLTLICAASAAGYLNLDEQRGFHAALLATLLLAAFVTSVMPMSVSVSLALLRDRGRHAFGIVRSAGTLGYLVAVAGFPYLLDLVGTASADGRAGDGAVAEPRLGFLLTVAAVWMGSAALVSLALPRGGAVGQKAAAGDWRLLMRRGPYLRLLLVTLLLFTFLQGPLVMFPMFVRSLGGDVATVSHMWIWMLAFEIPLMAGVAAAPEWVGSRDLVGIGVAAYAVRWLVCGLSSNLTVIYVVQVLHGLGVAGFVVGSALYVEAVVPGRLRSTAQGIVFMAGVSLGGIVSSAAAGALMDAFGARAPALVSGVGGMLLALSLPWLLPSVPRHSHDDVVAMEAVDERPDV